MQAGARSGAVSAINTFSLLYAAVAYSLNARHRLPAVFVRKASVASTASTIVSCRT